MKHQKKYMIHRVLSFAAFYFSLLSSCSSVQKNNYVCDETRSPANQGQCEALFSNTIKQSDNYRRQEKDIEKTGSARSTLIPTYLNHKKMQFHEIKPGQFTMYDYNEMPVKVEITKPFQLMDTEMTQMQAARISIAVGVTDLNKINPSVNKTGPGSEIISIDGVDVQMKKNYPVESMSHNEVLQFIAALNKLSNSGAQETQKMLAQIIPDHKKGDVYNLPTEAQLEFVKSDRGRKYFDKSIQFEADGYAWYVKNSENQTQEVGNSKPQIIDGKSFYGLFGNVWEMTRDFKGSLAGGKDPVGLPSAGYQRVIRGGSFESPVESMFSGSRYGVSSDIRSNSMGFRLVRNSQ